MRSSRAIAALLVLGLLVGGGFVLFRLFLSPRNSDRRASGDPRLTYAGPLHNVRPEVKYVGDDECARCHEQETKTFRQHPMGRSLFPLATVPERPPIDAAHNNPFRALAE